MTRSAALSFYVGIPVLCGLLLGWNRIAVGPYLTRISSAGYWTVLVVMVWFAALIGTRLVHLCVRRWRLPLWATALGGAVVGIALFYWPIASYRRFILHFLPVDLAQRAPPLPLPTLDYLPQLFTNTAAGVVFWVLILYVYDRLLGIPRYRTVNDVPETAAEVKPAAIAEVDPAHVPVTAAEEALRARLPPHLDGEIIALQAEDHYVRVHTHKGSTLVHYRFRDAVQDLVHADGLQVHRSFWVRRSAVAQQLIERHSHFVQMNNGLKVPVSRTHLHSLRTSRESMVS
ncbi:MAG: LytTR family DNA-binding domain-containing protein [Steroidobacteraceae bacterium]